MFNVYSKIFCNYTNYYNKAYKHKLDNIELVQRCKSIDKNIDLIFNISIILTFIILNVKHFDFYVRWVHLLNSNGLTYTIFYIFLNTLFFIFISFSIGIPLGYLITLVILKDKLYILKDDLYEYAEVRENILKDINYNS